MTTDPREQEKKATAALREYLEAMRRIQDSGDDTPENSRIPPLVRLLNGVADALRMPVFCKSHPSGKGKGGSLPDFSLREKRTRKGELLDSKVLGLPEHGVGEAKGLGADIHDTAESSQVRGYLKRYGLVLVTNFRQFLLLERGEKGSVRASEKFTLAGTSKEFEARLEHPVKFAREHGPGLGEFLRRVFQRWSPLESVDDVARTLASYAAEALEMVEENPPTGMKGLKRDLQKSLGMKFTGDEGDHLFHSALIQALFYGMFSAWVDHVKEKSEQDFNWRASDYSLALPILRKLFREVANPDTSTELQVVLDSASAALSRVSKEKFFLEFRDEDAVQHFYEPFLAHLDPALRRRLGVWYTPKEVVRYMVGRVDRVLREELKIPLGLADDSVYVLDPCCGTGAYLVEVLRRVDKTLQDRLDTDERQREVKAAARGRIFGFELMPAPFVVSHWRLNRLLAEVSTPFVGDERASVYLTNALTGWKPPKGPTKDLVELEGALLEERQKADDVKRKAPILVVLGNPPYSAFAGASPEEEAGLVDPYKQGLKEWRVSSRPLSDLYVRFFRIAERLITETEQGRSSKYEAKKTRGIVCYVTNHSYTDRPSFVVMRQKFLSSFDKIWIDGLNGDSRETKKKTPDGDPDPSVFSTSHSGGVGVRVGISIGLFLRSSGGEGPASVFHRDFWGKSKREDLQASLETETPGPRYQPVRPNKKGFYALRPLRFSESYLKWPSVADLCRDQNKNPPAGLLEALRRALIQLREKDLLESASAFFDRGLRQKEYERRGGAAQADRRAVAHGAREDYDPEQVSRYLYRPFDTRWAYVSRTRGVWGGDGRALRPALDAGVPFLITRRRPRKRDEGLPALYTRLPGDLNLFSGGSKCIPFHTPGTNMLENGSVPNLSEQALEYLSARGFAEPSEDKGSAAVVWMHVLAICAAPEYRRENNGGVRSNWPRVPLPKKEARLRESAALGERVAALFDTAEKVSGVTTLDAGGHLTRMAVLKGEDYSVDVMWGHDVGDGIIMPSSGKTQVRAWREDERRAIEAGLSEAGIDPKRGMKLLGGAVDVHLNGKNFWGGVPEAAWNFHVGGYQVLKIWLSHRQKAVIDRALDEEEAKEFTRTARRLASLVLMTDALDANYRAARDDSFEWKCSPPPKPKAVAKTKTKAKSKTRAKARKKGG